jgi:hypothetical protein
MSLRAEALPGDPNIVALLYGPIVLAGALGTENLPDVYLKDLHTRTTELNDWPVPQVPVLESTAQNLPAHVEPLAGTPLTFRTKGIGRPHDVDLIPFHRMHHQRYTVYWQLPPGT